MDGQGPMTMFQLLERVKDLETDGDRLREFLDVFLASGSGDLNDTSALDLAEEISKIEDGQAHARVAKAIAALLEDKIPEVIRLEYELRTLLMFQAFTQPLTEAGREVLQRLVDELPKSSWGNEWHARMLSSLCAHERQFGLSARPIDFWLEEKQQMLYHSTPEVVWSGMVQWGKETRNLARAFDELSNLCLATGEMGTHRIVWGLFASVIEDVVSGNEEFRLLLRAHNSGLPAGIRAVFNGWFIDFGYLPPWPEIVPEDDCERLLLRLSPADADTFEAIREG